MTLEDFKNLHIGDLVSNKSSGAIYVVTNNYGDRVTAIKTVDLTNPNEWEVASKAVYIKPQ